MTQIKQTLLLNSSAILLHSCDSLFVTHQLQSQNIRPYFPFLESIFEELLQRLKEEPYIIFEGIETKHNFLPGYYDYVFSFVSSGGKKLVQWQIMDETAAYNEKKIQQQSSHEKSAFSGRDSSNLSR